MVDKKELDDFEIVLRNNSREILKYWPCWKSGYNNPYEGKKCMDSFVQEYNCEVLKKNPFPEIKYPLDNEKEFISMDKCLLNEILYLWSKGIRTTGCCCGKHGNSDVSGYIGVFKEDIQKMKDLEYEVQYNPNRPDDDDTFYYKTNIDTFGSKFDVKTHFKFYE